MRRHGDDDDDVAMGAVSETAAAKTGDSVRGVSAGCRRGNPAA